MYVYESGMEKISLRINKGLKSWLERSRNKLVLQI